MSIWSTGFLRFSYQADINIPKEFFHSATFSPQNRASKLAIWPRPSRLAKFLGLLTDDLENGILASKASCLHEVHVYAEINYSVFGGYRCLVQIPHDFRSFGNHTISAHAFKFKSAIEVVIPKQQKVVWNLN